MIGKKLVNLENKLVCKIWTLTNKKFGIYAWPAYKSKKYNPYNYLIYDSIEKQGFKVFDFTFEFKVLIGMLFNSSYKIFHIHWPHQYLISSGNYRKSHFRIFVFAAFIKCLKFLGKKIVYTVHNLEAHENEFPNLQCLISKLLYNNADAFISLNKGGIPLLRKKIKSVIRQKLVFIPHPHYKDFYQNSITKMQARKKLEISQSAFVFLFVGQIKAYKNVENLIKAFIDLKMDNILLLIGGAIDKDVAYLNAYTNYSPDIKFHNFFIPDDDLQIYFNASNLVVTPYCKIFNSGSVFLNLSFNKPTLAPDFAVFQDLKGYFGSELIKTYGGEIGSEILCKAMNEVIVESKTALADLQEFAPEIIADQTLALYKSLL